MTNLERLEREAADLERAATSCWRRDTPAGQEDAQFAAAIRTVLAEHAAQFVQGEKWRNKWSVTLGENSEVWS